MEMTEEFLEVQAKVLAARAKHKASLSGIELWTSTFIFRQQKKRKLAKDFKTSRVTVWSALNFKTQSGFAQTLRVATRERGGVI